MVSRYLESLDAELRVPRRARARILAEVRDHLHEAVTRQLEQGRRPEEAQRAAVEAFGDPRELATSFHEELASASAGRASWRTALLLVAFVLAGLAAAGGRLNDFPYGIVIWLAAQVAVVAGAIGVARWLRYRGEGGIPSRRVRDVYLANAVAVACVAVAALAEGMNALTHSSTWPAGYAIGSAVVLAGALAAGVAVARAAARARALEPAPPTGELAFDDLLAVARMASAAAERRVPSATRLRGGAERAVAAARERAPRAALWLDLRRSPWRFCAIFAAVCGLALAAAHGITDGGGPATLSNAARALAGGLLLFGIEAAAVVLCFAAFGRLLGIRR